MKNITFIVFFLAGLLCTACSDDSVSNQQKEPEKTIVEFAEISTSEEDGFKKHILTIDSLDITMATYYEFNDSWYIRKDTIRIETWNFIQKSIDFKELLKLESIILPYDTTKRNGWIEVEKGKQSKKILFDFSRMDSLPLALHNVKEAIMPAYKFPVP